MTMTPSDLMISDQQATPQLKEFALGWMLNNEDWRSNKISDDEFERTRAHLLGRSELFYGSKEFVLEWMAENQLDLPPRQLSVMEQRKRYDLHFIDKVRDAVYLLGAENVQNNDGLIIAAMPLESVEHRVSLLVRNGMERTQAEFQRHIAFVVNDNHYFLKGSVKPPLVYFYPRSLREVAELWKNHTHSPYL